MPATCAAQMNPTSAYFEVLGNTRLYSFNVDTVYNEYWGIRFGGAIDGIDFDTLQPHEEGSQSFLFLSTLNRFVGEWPHVLEVGLGGITGFHQGEQSDTIRLPAATATLGYRLQTESFLFRLSCTPILPRKSNALLSVGISFGLTFE